jgi:hypothetical protein
MKKNIKYVLLGSAVLLAACALLALTGCPTEETAEPETKVIRFYNVPSVPGVSGVQFMYVYPSDETVQGLGVVGTSLGAGVGNPNYLASQIANGEVSVVLLEMKNATAYASEAAGLSGPGAASQEPSVTLTAKSVSGSVTIVVNYAVYPSTVMNKTRKFGTDAIPFYFNETVKSIDWELADYTATAFAP